MLIAHILKKHAELYSVCIFNDQHYSQTSSNFTTYKFTRHWVRKPAYLVPVPSQEKGPLQRLCVCVCVFTSFTEIFHWDHKLVCTERIIGQMKYQCSHGSGLNYIMLA